MIHRYCVWAFAFFIAFDLTFAAKEKEELPAPPPMARSENVATYRGRTVKIPLRAMGRTPGQLKFLIRTKPKHGTLSEITLVDRKNAFVLYTHDERHGAGVDSFTFAVQAQDSPVSAPGTISIAVSEEPSAFSVVHALDFGQVLLGESREDEITIRNAGGGTISGRITAPPSWKILGSATYQLGRQQEQKVLLVFEPTKAVESVEKLLFSHDARTSVTLTGTGVSPLAIEPGKEIELKAQKGSSTRTTELLIRNLTDRPRVIEIKPPDHIVEPEELTVPPNGEARMELKTEADFIGAIEGSLTISSEGYREEIPLRAYALRPSLQVEPGKGFDFGDVQPGRRYKGVLQLKNTGGLEARITTDLPTGLLLTPDPGSVVIAPGETRVFEFAFEPLRTGDLQQEIILHVANGDTVRIPVRAVSTAPVQPTPPQTRQPATVVEVPGHQESMPESVSGIPAITDIVVQETTQHSVELGWKKPAANALGTLVEYRQLEPVQDGPPKIKWVEWKGAKFFEENGMTIARFDNLPPGRSWYIRISSIDEIGKRSAPSSTIQLASLPAQKWQWPWWIGGFLLLGGVGWTIFYLRQRRQNLAAEEAQRISHLENP